MKQLLADLLDYSVPLIGLVAVAVLLINADKINPPGQPKDLWPQLERIFHLEKSSDR